MKGFSVPRYYGVQLKLHSVEKHDTVSAGQHEQQPRPRPARRPGTTFHSTFDLQSKEAGIMTLVALDDQGGEWTEWGSAWWPLQAVPVNVTPCLSLSTL